MKIRKSAVTTTEKVELHMTPMIDCVFQLLAFFIMTFRIASVEGDFNVTMPLSGPGLAAEAPEPMLALRVELTADADGHLAGIRWEGQPLRSLAELHGRAAQAVADNAVGADEDSDLEVELAFDDDLQYRYVVDAITAISGYIDPQTGRQNKLIQKLKFAPQ